MYRLATGVSFSPAEALYEHRQDGDAMVVAGLCTRDMQGPRIGGRIIRIEVSAPLEGVLRVRATHHANGKNGGSLLVPHPSRAPCVTETEDALRLSSGDLTLALSKQSWGYRFEHAGTSLCGSGADCLGSVACADGSHYMTEKLSLAPGECVYGLGERFSPFVRNGQSVPMWNTDAATVSDLAYKNIPLYLSSIGYGVFVNTSARAEFEIATEDNSGVRITVPGHEIDYLVIAGSNPREVLDRFTALTGRPALIPKWSLGLWLTTSFTTTYNERTVLEHVEEMHRRKLPLGVFHFDCYWMRERHWCDFQWDPVAFPDPPGMIRKLKKLGLRICLWINPYVSELSDLHGLGVERSYFLKRRDGSVYQIDWWQPGVAFVDFTNPEARAWYRDKLAALLDMGVDTFKTDFGESAPEDAVYADGSDPAVSHNRYALDFNQTVFELLEQKRGCGEAVVFARSATAGSQRYPVHWGGDCAATYASMAAELRGGLSFSLSGGAFWSHDIGGFYGQPTPDLYKRWIAFGLLSSHSRLHGESSYRVPWLFDEESVDVLRHFTALRLSLIPYLYSHCHEAHEHGLPLMRPMLLEFPEDPTCRHLDRQYMLGSELLVAPVLDPAGNAEHYLPPGVWTDFWTGRRVTGGCWKCERYDYFHLPLYVREGSILPLGPAEGALDRSSFDDLTLRVYGLTGTALFRVRDKGRTVEVRATRAGDAVKVELSETVEGLRVQIMDMAEGAVVSGHAKLLGVEGTVATLAVAGTAFTVRPR
jgi:alpha-D-xyloside xylohydrolase